jgi:hypothetical protein
MADPMTQLADMATMFEKTTANHTGELTTLKNAALRHKAQCEQFITDMAQKYDRLADTIQGHVATVQGFMDELRPIIQEVKREAKKAPHARKAGV